MPERTEDEVKLAIAMDVAHPGAYLALHPTLSLIDELEIQVDWLPVTAPPWNKRLPEGDDRGSRHRRHRSAYAGRDVRRYAAFRGLVLENLDRSADSSLAGRGLLTAKRHAAERDYLMRIFAGHWSAEIDIEDPAAIGAVLAACGIHDEMADEAEFADLQQATARLGLWDSPGYLVEGEPFIGRAHLPMIRWILSGRQGTLPI